MLLSLFHAQFHMYVLITILQIFYNIQMWFFVRFYLIFLGIFIYKQNSLYVGSTLHRNEI